LLASVLDGMRAQVRSFENLIAGKLCEIKTLIVNHTRHDDF
jgi:hypothetical protein